MGLIKSFKKKLYKIKYKKLDLINKIEKKKIIITGANSGIGLELVRELHKKNKIFAFINKDSDNLKDIINKNLEIFSLDFENLELLLEHEKKIHDFKINILINCAAFFGGNKQDLNDINVKTLLKTFSINTLAPLFLSKFSLNSEIEQIINISSEMGSLKNNKNKGFYNYKISKNALNMITKNLSLEFNNKKPIVYSIHPGSVKTKMNSSGYLSPNHAAKKIISIISANDLNLSGKFIDLNKKDISW